VPLSVILFKTVEPKVIPSALALTRLVQQIGASVGSAYAATLLDRGYDTARASMASSITLDHSAIAAFVAAHGAHAAAMLDGLIAFQARNEAAVTATQFFSVATMIAAVLPFVLARTVDKRVPRMPEITVVAPEPTLVPAHVSADPEPILTHA
jgi:hypothetical protein